MNHNNTEEEEAEVCAVTDCNTVVRARSRYCRLHHQCLIFGITHYQERPIKYPPDETKL